MRTDEELEQEIVHAQRASNDRLLALLLELKERRTAPSRSYRHSTEERIYRCDYRAGAELVVVDDRLRGGDFYIGSRPEGDRVLLNGVRICTSGGASEKAPLVLRAVHALWAALAHQGGSS